MKLRPKCYLYAIGLSLVDATEALTGRLDIDSSIPIVESKRLNEKFYEVFVQAKVSGLHDIGVKCGENVVVEGIIYFRIIITKILKLPSEE